MKKGDIAINTIIIAAIAITVFIIVSYIFISEIRKDTESLRDCEIAGGQCVDAETCPTSKFKGECETGICCIKLGG